MWLWRGRRGFLGQVVRLVLGASIAVVLCVAGVGFGDIRLAFVQQAWHLVTSTWLSCGRSHTTLSHNFVAHNSLSRTRTHTLVQLFPAQLCHTHTHNFFTQVCHTQLFHTRFYFPAQLFVSQNSFTYTHTRLFHTHNSSIHTHNVVTCNAFHRHTRAHTHTLSLSHRQLFHTQLFHIRLLRTTSPPPSPLCFQPRPSHFHTCLTLLEETDMWASGPTFDFRHNQCSKGFPVTMWGCSRCR